MRRIIEVIPAYSNRLIEGIDRGVILERIKGGHFKHLVSGSGIIVDLGSQQEVLVDCVYKYFEPVKSYWKLQEKDGCKKKQNAFGITHCTYCHICISRCIEAGLTIKANKKRR